MLLFLACADELPPIPEGLRALEDNTASFPETESLNVLSGQEDDYDWVHAAGRIDAPLSEVWTAILVEDVFIDRRQVDEWDITWDTEPEYDESCVLDNTVHDVITIEWVTAWREALVWGTEDDMELVAIRFEKIDGTDVIERMVGSLHLVKLDDDTTHWSYIEHLAAMRRDPEPLVVYVVDFYDETLLTLAGQELPDYSSEDED
ncbi:MAG TPA: hypothetical protein QGF58_11260 [Myxococcota bacterium]|nr:hypothetical protein [Myxococcota bacterium]